MRKEGLGGVLDEEGGVGGCWIRKEVLGGVVLNRTQWKNEAQLSSSSAKNSLSNCWRGRGV